MLFEELQLAPNILAAVAAEGYTTPTPIQQQAIPHALAGRDLIGLAQTGTGKTAAFALPILHRLSAKPHVTPRRIRCLVLTPTRELASQIGDSFHAYGKNTGLRHFVIFGGVGQDAQARALRAGLDTLIATPGRLLDLMQQGLVHLDQVETFVLDEADRMLDMGFIHDVRKVIAKLPRVRQTLFFSATMPPDIQELADSILKDPVQVAVAPVSATADRIEQKLYFVEKAEKRGLLVHLLKDAAITRVLVFTRTKHGANRVSEWLEKAHIKSEAIHGNKSQNARERALAHFKDGSTPVLVATDIAARGIDVDEISHIINFDLPNIPETYVHRIGRTARAGASGIALSFCDSEEREYLRDIERLIRRHVPVVENHEYASRTAPPPLTDLTPRSGQRAPSSPSEARQQQPANQRRGHGTGHQRPQPAGHGERPPEQRRAASPRPASDRPQPARSEQRPSNRPAGGGGGQSRPSGGGGGGGGGRPATPAGGRRSQSRGGTPGGGRA